MRKQSLLYIIVATVIFLAVLLLFILSPSSDVDTPAVVLPTTSPGDGDTDPSPKPERPEDQAVVLSADTVQAALSTLSRADNYSRILSVETFWSDGSSSQSIDVAARGGSTKLAIFSGEESPVRHVLLSGLEKWIWYSDSQILYHGAATPDDPDRYQTLLSYEDILALPRENILEAAHRDYEGTMCIFVRYISGEFGYENIAYIALNSGLLLSLESYDGDTLIYRMSSTAPELSTPDESVFFIPENLQEN